MERSKYEKIKDNVFLLRCQGNPCEVHVSESNVIRIDPIDIADMSGRTMDKKLLIDYFTSNFNFISEFYDEFVAIPILCLVDNKISSFGNKDALIVCHENKCFDFRRRIEEIDRTKIGECVAFQMMANTFQPKLPYRGYCARKFNNISRCPDSPDFFKNFVERCNDCDWFWYKRPRGAKKGYICKRAGIVYEFSASTGICLKKFRDDNLADDMVCEIFYDSGTLAWKITDILRIGTEVLVSKSLKYRTEFMTKNIREDMRVTYNYKIPPNTNDGMGTIVFSTGKLDYSRKNSVFIWKYDKIIREYEAVLQVKEGKAFACADGWLLGNVGPVINRFDFGKDGKAMVCKWIPGIRSWEFVRQPTLSELQLTSYRMIPIIKSGKNELVTIDMFEKICQALATKS